MKINRLTVIFFVCLVALVLFAILSIRRNREQACEILRLQSNIEALQSDIKTYKSKDGKNVSEVKVQTLTANEVKEILKEELASINVKSKDVHSATKIVEEQKATVVLDTVFIRDTVFAMNYKDPWLDITISKDTANIHLKDSILVVSYAKTRRFLWWKWKIYSGKTSVKNYSPYSTITTLEAVEVVKN